MSFVSLLTGWIGSSRKLKPLFGCPGRQDRATPRRSAPRLEQLESRLTPSNLVTLATPVKLWLPAPMHFEFGPKDAQPAPGYTLVSSNLYSSETGFGWLDASGITLHDYHTGNPLTSYNVIGKDNTFEVNLANGLYDVAVTVGDYKYKRDDIGLFAQGAEAATGLSIGVAEFLQPTFQASVVNGLLKVQFVDQGGVDPSYAVATLDIRLHPSAEPTGAFYVAVNGNDANDGMSPGTSFATLAAAASHATLGDTIYIGGGTYYQQLVTKSSGISGQSILITSYNGTATLDGSTQSWVPGSNQNQGIIQVQNDFVTISGLNVINSENSGVVLSANDVTISNCQVSYTERHAITTNTQFQGIYDNLLHDLTIENNMVTQAVLMGRVYGQAISVIADGFLVEGNTVWNNNNIGIDIWLGAVHGEVTGNTTYGNAQAGIYTDGASYVRVDGNLVYSNAKGIGVSSEDPHYAAHDVWVYNNVVHDNQGAGIFIWDSPTHPGYPGVQNVIITNNTVIDNQTSFYFAGSNDTALVMNNLDYTTGTSYFSVATNSTLTFQSNITLSDLSGFVSPSTYNFQLNSTSPAINQGSPLPTFSDDLGNTFSITVDYLGNPRVVGGAPDVGAYEYQGGVSQMAGVGSQGSSAASLVVSSQVDPLQDRGERMAPWRYISGKRAALRDSWPDARSFRSTKETALLDWLGQLEANEVLFQGSSLG
jgi:hypothetical protein